MRAPFILYKRSAGKKRPTYYVGFWSEAHRGYRDRTSVQRIIDALGARGSHLNATSRASAEAAVRMWLAAGTPTQRGETWWTYLDGFWGRDGAYATMLRDAGKRISNAYADDGRYTLRKFVEPYLRRVGRADITLSQVDAELVETMLRDLQKREELSGRRLNQIRQFCSVAMKEAARLGKTTRNPVTDVIKFREASGERRILTRAEALRILAKLDELEDRRLPVIHLLAATTGMRLGECLGLTIDRLHSETVEIEGGTAQTFYWIELEGEASNWTEADRHHGAKSGSTGEVPVPARTAEAIRDLHASNPGRNGWVFWSTKKGRPMIGRDAAEAYNAACQAIGITDDERKARRLGFHAWRHFYVSMMRANTESRAVQAVVRHSNESTTKRYSHLTDEQRREIAGLAGGLLSE